MPADAIIYATCAMSSLITHPFVWLWALIIFPDSPELIRLWTVEALVVLIEGAILFCFVPWQATAWCSMATPFVVSLVMNTASVLVGLRLSTALQMSAAGWSPVTSLVSWSLAVYLGLSLWPK